MPCVNQGNSFLTPFLSKKTYSGPSFNYTSFNSEMYCNENNIVVSNMVHSPIVRITLPLLRLQQRYTSNIDVQYNSPIPKKGITAILLIYCYQLPRSIQLRSFMER